MIRLATAASADLQGIIRRLKPRAGTEITGQVVETILAAIGRLNNMPMGGRTGRVAGTREPALTRYPYVIIYKIDDELVTVARIMHARQRWPGPERS